MCLRFDELATQSGFYDSNSKRNCIIWVPFIKIIDAACVRAQDNEKKKKGKSNENILNKQRQKPETHFGNESHTHNPFTCTATKNSFFICLISCLQRQAKVNIRKHQVFFSHHFFFAAASPFRLTISIKCSFFASPFFSAYFVAAWTRCKHFQSSVFFSLE